MLDLSYVKIGQISGTCTADAGVTKIAKRNTW